jgi:hypothetical protein
MPARMRSGREQFNFVSNGSGVDPVGNNQEFKTHILNGVQVPKNGYLYIYACPIVALAKAGKQ